MRSDSSKAIGHIVANTQNAVLIKFELKPGHTKSEQWVPKSVISKNIRIKSSEAHTEEMEIKNWFLRKLSISPGILKERYTALQLKTLEQFAVTLREIYISKLPQLEARGYNVDTQIYKLIDDFSKQVTKEAMMFYPTTTYKDAINIYNRGIGIFKRLKTKTPRPATQAALI